MNYKKILKSASKLINQIKYELEEDQAVHEIIQKQGLVLTFDGDFGFLACQTKDMPEPSQKQYPIPLPVDNWTIPTQELYQTVLDKIIRGMYNLIEDIIKNKTAKIQIRKLNIKTKPKLKAIAKAHGFSTINSFLDYFVEKEFDDIPERFKEDLFL